jgi:hypothetical protein
MHTPQTLFSFAQVFVLPVLSQPKFSDQKFDVYGTFGIGAVCFLSQYGFCLVSLLSFELVGFPLFFDKGPKAV